MLLLEISWVSLLTNLFRVVEVEEDEKQLYLNSLSQFLQGANQK